MKNDDRDQTRKMVNEQDYASSRVQVMVSSHLFGWNTTYLSQKGSTGSTVGVDLFQSLPLLENRFRDKSLFGRGAVRS